MKAKPKKTRANQRPLGPKSKKGAVSSVRNEPPERTRFRRGKSGNPKGRPKGSKNLSTIMMEAARAPVTATINGKLRKISKLQATAMQLATKAAAGDRAAMGKFLDWMDEYEARAAAARPAEFPLNELDLEVLRAIYERMKKSDPESSEE